MRPVLSARRFRLFFIALALPFGLAAQAGAAPSQPPDEFIRTLSKEAVTSLTQSEVNNREREQRFRELFTENFDVPRIAQFVLGVYWPRATPAQRAEYLRLFEDFIVKSYSKKFGEYSGEEFKTGSVIRMSETDSVVSSLIKPGEKPPVRVDWRVRANGTKYKIIDVLVEGISMSVTHRDEFASVIRAQGGTVAGLLDALKKKTQ